MSTVSPELISIENAGLYEDAGLAVTDIEAALRRDRVARVSMGLDRIDFQELSDAFAGCIEEAVPAIGDTLHMVDPRYGHTAGYFRKERKVDAAGRQIEDPKHVFQFNEQARGRWREQFALAPLALKAFLELGYEVQEELAKTAKNAIDQLSVSRPGLVGEFYPENVLPVSFMRVVRYDSYPNEPDSPMLPVAKPHIDICGYTLQPWSSGPGFWGRTPRGKQFFDDQGDDGYFFASLTHKKIFGKESSIDPLIHGVDRVAPDASVVTVPERTAVVLFVNPWRIDPKVTPIETKAA